MTNLRRFALVTAVAACLAPVPAYAHVGWWDWLDKLSGPGPFSNGIMLDMRLFCQVDDENGIESNALGEKAGWVAPSFKKESRGRACLTNATSATTHKNLVHSYFEVRGGHISSESQPLFSDAPKELIGTVSANTVMSVFMRQLDPSFAVGTKAN